MYLYRTQSSANRRTEDVMLSCNSFIKIKNRVGPKVDPWDQPVTTATRSETCPSKAPCLVHPESHELARLWVYPLIPFKSNLCNSLLCGTLSKAFAKSITIKVHDS